MNRRSWTQIRTFLVLADDLHFGRAAHCLSLSQPRPGTAGAADRRLEDRRARAGTARPRDHIAYEGTGWAFRNVIGQQASLRHRHRVASPFWQTGASGPGQGAISYRELTAMPTDPARAHRVPGGTRPRQSRLRNQGAIISRVGKDRPHRVFASIMEIFDRYVPTARQAVNPRTRLP